MNAIKQSKMQYKYFIIITFILLSFNVLGQSKHSIQININGFSDTNLFLTSYFGNKIHLVDTAYSSNGKFIFSRKNSFPGGIYMVVSKNKSKLFEFIINQDSKITFTTDTTSYIDNMRIKGSKENKVFFNYVKYNETLFKKNKKLTNELNNTNKDEPAYSVLLIKLDSLNKESIDFKKKLMDTNPDLFVSKLLNSMHNVEVPDSILNKKDSLLSYLYFKKHFWDNLNLSDSRFLRTPMLNKKVNEYFELVIAFQPDSVIKGIDIVLNNAKSSKEVFSFLIWKFIGDYQNPKYMGFDKVFVHLAETYFQNSEYEIENLTPSVKNSIIERSKKIKPLLLGSLGPDLILIDTSGQYTSFNHLRNKYIVVIFWDYDCGICKKELKFINENKKNWQYDVGIFAVNVNGDLEKWKKYITDNSLNWMNVNGTHSVTPDFHDVYDIYGTPVIYLLDKKRNIVAKRMNANQLIPIIENIENRKE